MARYTGLFVVAVPMDRLRQLVIDILQSNGCNIMYDSENYVMAREIPGQIAVSKLVTVEVMIDRPTDETQAIRMNFLLKNDELPLHTDNHCRQMFNLIQYAIEHNRQWHLVESTVN